MADRWERDSLGTLKVPADAYYGIFTQRAKGNFHLSGQRVPLPLIHTLVLIKKAAANVNMQLGLLDKKLGAAIVAASSDVLKDKNPEPFPMDIFQAGAGTPMNMNVNEVLANLATEKLGGKKGEYLVHPNNHVNMAQSSNDVVPTAIRLAVALQTPALLVELIQLAEIFERKAKQYENVVKVGRTHLQDAVPIRYGQVFRAYANAMRKAVAKIEHAERCLYAISIGGTAVGTGLNAHPKYRKMMLEELKKATKLPLEPCADMVVDSWSMTCFVEYSNALRMLALDLGKLCDDLRLLASGPYAGVNEISLPEVEPGSSIMPGKINPSIPEAVNMVCYQIVGNDAAVCAAANASQLELGVMTPVIAHNLLSSAELLTNAVQTLREKCVVGMTVNKERCQELLMKSPIIATALNQYLGYEVVAELVKMSLRDNRPIKDLIVLKGLVSKNDLAALLDPRYLTGPSVVDQKLVKKIQNGEAYKRFRNSLR
ncbi:aspartate ammonia-lyase [Candidatus Woesearchaeota archaeon]|nr:aspartate ammonia-lyase [Candidatus Woesearchaeota archaeon]